MPAPTRRRPALVAALACAAAVAVAGSSVPAATAPAPPLQGAWTWTDRDELLAAADNPTVARFTVHGHRARVRFGTGRAVAVRWNRRRGTIAFVAPRRAATPRVRTVRVRYTGRLVREAGTPTIRGTFRVRGQRLPSAFSATRRGR